MDVSPLKMRAYVLPISGGYFPYQVGLLEQLIQHDERPDVMLSTSGGNLAAYMAMASGWNHHEIKRIASTVSSSNIVETWSLGSVSALLNGSMYGTKNCYGFFDGMVGNRITDMELWTGTYNKKRSLTCLYCNQRNSRWFSNTKRLERLGCMPLRYCHGNTDLITDVCMASAAVPAVYPERLVASEPHIDGGVSFSSPLSLLHDQLPKDAQIVYIHSQKFELTSCPTGNTGIMENTKYAMSQMVNSMLYQERMLAHDFVSKGGYKVKTESIPGNPANLSTVLNRSRRIGRCLVELYPHTNEYLDFGNFNGDDVVRLTNLRGYDIEFTYGLT